MNKKATQPQRAVPQLSSHKDYYSVNVYWPKDDAYGGGQGKLSLTEVPGAVRRLVMLNYGKPECPIHVTRHWEPIIEQIITDGPERKAKLEIIAPAYLGSGPNNTPIAGGA